MHLSQSNLAHFEAKYLRTDTIPYLNTTAYVWSIHLHRKLPITQKAWHNVAVTLCPSVYSGQILRGKLEGEVAFRNPYGYLPGEMYGMLPFAGARALCVLGLFIFFLCHYFYYADSCLPLHTGIVIVQLIALVEFVVWFSAYLVINESGLPYCCPFPKEVVAALILQVFRQTVSRVLLLVVCLGYGIVRPRLLPVEVYAVAFMAGAYFVASIVASVAQIMHFQRQVNLSSEDTSGTYGVPQFLLDVLFLSWIYISLTSTIRILTEFKQAAKLKLYEALHRTIIGFVTMFVGVTILGVAGQVGFFVWPWEYLWLMDVLWECINVAVLFAVSIICLPSDTSRLLTYASQLPTSDDDDDLDHLDHMALMMADDDELDSMDDTTHGGEVEMHRRVPSAQAEKHRRIIEAQKAKQRNGLPEHYGLPDSIGMYTLFCNDLDFYMYLINVLLNNLYYFFRR